MQIPKVLLVNDDAASLFALESLLTSAMDQNPYELVTATSGHETLRKVLTHEFAVILLDVNMPGMDGFETAEAIHSHPRSSSVPIIFITAYYADEMHRLKAYQSGAADYLFTPVIPQVLQTKVAVFVDLTRKNLELRAKTAELSLLNQDLRVQRMQDLKRINAELEQEVAERKLAEQRAHDLSIRDALTGLVNRRSLIQQLEHAVATCDRHQGECALLFLDLDRFKQVNDSLGHQAGDELLRQVAARLLASVRVSDVVTRLGGDEFVVLLEGKGAAANAARVARKISVAHARPFDIDGHGVQTGTSIGIALYPQDAGNAAALMRNADRAMYYAKQNKRGGIEFFREELNARETERALWTRELKHALDNGEFELAFQPRAGVANGELRGIDAHLCWRHPRHGLVEARDHVSGVTERGLLERVDAWTIGEACAQAAQWRGSAAPLPAPPMSVRLLSAGVSAALAQQVLARLRACKLPAGALELQVTEQMLAGRRDADHALHALHQGGVSLVVDDFGSAGAGPGLGLLRTLPFAALRIDSSFVSAIGEPGGEDMLAALVHLSRALGLRVLAKGVLTNGQLAVLNSLGCDEYHGELFSPALQAAPMLALLEQAGTRIPPKSHRAPSRANLSTPRKRGHSR
ncbi:diguanylate cyclase [Massilia sp. RP-1-19]|uniref:Diguanylate cyclase n=1 Tax=Massilia polaris TaxID=2728846 RepID=A0A848HN51_9BURK|nr:diguanylate cyclase [Massilia polaris]